MKVPATQRAAPTIERPRLELSGPKLALALEQLVTRTEEQGGIEHYVEALRVKAAAFREVFAAGGTSRAGGAGGAGGGGNVELAAFRTLCACIATVRRRAARYLEPDTFPALRARLHDLVQALDRTADTDARVAAFCAGFPADREHRWVRDLAAEVLHNVDPERYPLMTRWVWDAKANTGVLREIWHAEDIDRTIIDVPDRYETYRVLREELSQFLTDNGVFRDTVHYVDLLTAQVYAGYISEQGGSYLRADFVTPEEPMLHVRRMLGLDAVATGNRTRLKAIDGTAVVVDEPRLTN